MSSSGVDVPISYERRYDTSGGIMAIAAPKNRERVARNFIRSHGRNRFRRLIEALSAGESGQTIAEELGVSRERIRQWKNTFGEMITVYQLHPEVERLLRERRASPMGREPTIVLDIDGPEEEE
jgi:hypothetical protein